MNRASPYPYCASAAHRGYKIPCFHWPRTSIQEFTWNSKSCPEGLPRKKKGRITRKAVAITMRRGKGRIFPPAKLTGTFARVVSLGSEEDELSREWPPTIASCTEIVA